MNFQSVYDIINTALTFFFPSEFLATPTVTFLVDLFLIIAGLYMLYFILVKPFIIAYRCIIRSWSMRK